MIKTVVITGPTASGKTDLSVRLAQKYGFEIICADSMQIYRELEIATARPTAQETRSVPHHLFGEISVCSEYSVKSFCEDASEIIRGITERGARAMLCGGTGLYIDSLINGTDFSSPNTDDAVRESLIAEYKNSSALHMHHLLCELDPDAARNIHPNNVKRVLRALEICIVTGESKTENDKKAVSHPSEFQPLYIGVTYKNRAALYERIDRRVDMMMQNGLIDEVRRFYRLPVCKTALGAIGCKELKPYLDNEKSLDECISELKTATRRYAKRQLTWFKRNNDINWLYPDEGGVDSCFKAAGELIERFYGGEYES